MSMKKIKVKLTFTEEILGTANATATIHDEYIASNFNSHAHVERDV